MRLLKTSDFQLEYFSDDRKIPDYAILSHTWQEGQEVLFADMSSGIETALGKSGFRKLQYSCKQAQNDGYEYIWIDTCCIDKGSSAELSEAINSMFAWYQKAEKCYAYLADFPANPALTSLAQSKWFTRGWTLQELIAPHTVVFYSSDWLELGTKWTLCNQIATRTGIDEEVLSGRKTLASRSIARRMSWACKRDTTRTEDQAYCLMGLFDVNMPMLYGEGSKAFLRLQEEIMKYSDDQSLFAWTDPAADEDEHKGLLATSPRYFEKGGDIVPYTSDWDQKSAPFSISNKGLCIDICLTRWKDDIYAAAINCPAPPNFEGFLGIYLKRLASNDGQFARVQTRTLCRLSAKGNPETVYIRQSQVQTTAQDVYRLHVFQLRQGPTVSADSGYTARYAAGSSVTSEEAAHLAKFAPKAWSKSLQTTFKISLAAGQLAGVIYFERHDGKRLLVLLGSLAGFTVGFDAVDINQEITTSILGTTISKEIALKLYQASFNPKAPGMNIVLEDHQVRLTAEQRVQDGIKYYMVDIAIEPIYHALNPIDMIKDRVPMLQNEVGQRPHNARPDPPRGFRKLRSALNI